jgi:Eco57I restriction-modification methylase
MLDPSRVRSCLQAFDLESLFIEELGWDGCDAALEADVDGSRFALRAVAEKRGVVALVLDAASTPETGIPPYTERRKIERRVAQSFRQHLVVYFDRAAGEQIWQWVLREPGRPLACREHRYNTRQSGEALIQKLQAIAFSLKEEEELTHVHVTGRMRAAFNVERATRRFYDRFRKERDAFQQFMQGIPDTELARWYVSVMLNRLMFIYFIQRKRFLDDDADYLRTKWVQSRARAQDRFYRDLLCPLFFEGFARPESERSPEARELLGSVPYLNGGIFQQHEVERLHGRTIQIPDAAFERLFDFFDGYQWHLDDRPLHDDREINADVLGYIFEKYINQKQMGAYYTQEDITGYISRNTILPFFLQEIQKACPTAFEGVGSLWSLLSSDPDRYIHDAVQTGTDLPLPPEIEAGIDDVGKRDVWNTRTPDPYALPTEIWRETVARRQRYTELRGKLAAGEVRSANDLVTLNLDIEQFAQDVVQNCADPDLLRAMWHTLNRMTVLDPTCGSGAFLFAALNVLEPLYEACLACMQAFLDELPPDAHPHKLKDYRAVLDRVAQHPNQGYFVLKSIVINNLYGVDIMAEAVEIAKLRLFLKLVSQVDRVENIEPLPDIDFNIQAGNTLVGFATYEEVERAVRSVRQNGAVQYRMMLDDDPMVAIEEKARDVDRLYRRFREQQTELGGEVTAADKRALRERLDALDEELDRYLAREYGVDVEMPMDLALWRRSHQPFHWFVEFYGTMRQGGFDVIIGNPPYVEYSKVREDYQVQETYRTLSCGNLYAFVLERAFHLTASDGFSGSIVPLSLVCTKRMEDLRSFVCRHPCWISCFDMRPSSLFEGIAQRLCILLSTESTERSGSVFTGGYRRWFTAERPALIQQTAYTLSTPNRAVSSIIPKVSSELELTLLERIRGVSLGLLCDRSATPVYVHRIVRYFVKALDFIPLFVEPSGTSGKSADYKEFRFLKPEQRAILALLNSSLFYWFWRTHSDGFHCGYGDVYRMPYKKEMSNEVREALSHLQVELMDGLRESSAEKAVTTKAGRIRYQEFSQKPTKPVIDEIDRILAQHYSFTDEELDFILNYDVKYRMGDELFEETEDE